MSPRSLLHPRASLALLPLLSATLLSAACRDGQLVSPDPDPLSPRYDLVFQESAPDGLQATRLMVRRLDVTGATPLYGTELLGGTPAPSADGSHVVFIGPQNDEANDDWQDLFIVRRNAPPQRIPLTAGAESGPTVSPDGTRVAYVKRNADAVSRLYIAALDGSSETALTVPFAPGVAFSYSTPAWSPDGTTLLFSAGEPGNLHLFTMRVDGTDLRQRTFEATGSDTESSWSPDGRSVAFVRGSSPARTMLVVRQLDTGTERAFDFPCRNRWPSWSPDGHRIAFSSNMSDNLDFELYVVRADGSLLERLTDDALQQRAPRWIRR